MNKLFDWVVAFACSALMAAALVGLAYVAFAPRPVFAARRVGTLLRPEDVKMRIAMFVIPVNSEDGDSYVGFSLRASTSNFSASRPETSRCRFFAQSEVADLRAGSGDIDLMKLFVCTSKTGADGRSYTRIGNTVSWTNRLTSVVALVDASCLVTHGSGDWLRSDNADLSWAYLRDMPVDPVSELEDGTESGQWRPITPVWLSSMPEWAK